MPPDVKKQANKQQKPFCKVTTYIVSLIKLIVLSLQIDFLIFFSEKVYENITLKFLLQTYRY